MIGHAGVEVIRAHDGTQGEVSFQRSAWRANPDHSALGDLLVQMAPRRGSRGGLSFQQGLAKTSFVVDELIPEPSTVAQEVAVHFVVIAVNDAPQRPIAFASICVAPESAVHAHRRSELLVPLASVVLLQGFISEHACGADFYQVSAEFILENAIFGSPKKDPVPQRKGIQVVTASIVAIVADAAVTLDAAIHLVIHQRSQILIAKRALLKLVAPIIVTGHHSHVLQVAFTALVTHRAIMRMIQHESLDNAGAEGNNLGISYGDTGAVGRGCHAGHDDLSVTVVLIPELLNSALTARTHRTQCWMPAEVRQLETVRETPVKQIILRIHPARFVVHIYDRHA